MSISLKKFSNKKIAILGLGIENLALVNFLLIKKVSSKITICDFRSAEQLGDRFDKLSEYRNISWKLGKEYNHDLDKFDILFRSPGWTIDCPGIKTALKIRKNRIILTSPIEIFMKLCPTKNVVGVTGTKGKGTTSSLIYEILKTAGNKAWLGGNIGVAPFGFIEKIKPADWVVLELSSFQLQGIKVSPHFAVITNFAKEHLSPADPNNPNFHKSLKEYLEAKLNIVRWQKKADKAVINKKLEARIKKAGLKAKIVYFNRSELPSKLIGEHNKENIAAAVGVAELIGIKEEKIRKAVAGFKGLEHRIEFVKEVKKTSYYDDSFATTPEAAVTALKSFDSPIILLAGGAEKKSDFKQFVKEIKKRAKLVILFAGDSSPRLKRELSAAGYDSRNIRQAGSMKEAVKIASDMAAEGDIVLLSTGCASFGIFKNYKERGDLFKQEVEKL